MDIDPTPEVEAFLRQGARLLLPSDAPWTWEGEATFGWWDEDQDAMMSVTLTVNKCGTKPWKRHGYQDVAR